MAKSDGVAESGNGKAGGEGDEPSENRPLPSEEVLQLLQLARNLQTILAALEQGLGGKVPDDLPPLWNETVRQALERLRHTLPDER